METTEEFLSSAWRLFGRVFCFVGNEPSSSRDNARKERPVWEERALVKTALCPCDGAAVSHPSVNRSAALPYKVSNLVAVPRTLSAPTIRKCIGGLLSFVVLV